MAYKTNFIRYTFGGSIADAKEIWSCGLAIINFVDADSTRPWFDEVATHIAAIGTKTEEFVQHADTLVPNNAKILWAKMAYIGTDGKYLAEAVEVPLNSGGGVNAPYSPQDALVIGLESVKWKDPGKNNRFYLPTFGPSGSNNWKLSTAEQDAVLAKAVTFVDAINTELSTVSGLGSTRVGIVSNNGAGYNNDCVAVRVGAIVDTQRRRRNKLEEDYVTDSVA